LLASTPGLTVLPATAQRAELFLQALDCFFYRTSPEWIEAFGRVVFEAMACGLPVVCERRGGYVEFIEHGRNGFLFDTEEEAFRILLRLREDAPWRQAVGAEARKTTEEIFSPERRAEVVQFFLR
jgi:glycosyltransferase involved in cell wall biosynthesis